MVLMPPLPPHYIVLDGSGHTSIIFSAPTEEMMQGFMRQPNQFLLAKFIGKYLLMRTKHMLGWWVPCWQKKSMTWCSCLLAHRV